MSVASFFGLSSSSSCSAFSPSRSNTNTNGAATVLPPSPRASVAAEAINPASESAKAYNAVRMIGGIPLTVSSSSATAVRPPPAAAVRTSSAHQQKFYQHTPPPIGPIGSQFNGGDSTHYVANRGIGDVGPTNVGHYSAQLTFRQPQEDSYGVDRAAQLAAIAYPPPSHHPTSLLFTGNNRPHCHQLSSTTNEQFYEQQQINAAEQSHEERKLISCQMDLGAAGAEFAGCPLYRAAQLHYPPSAAFPPPPPFGGGAYPAADWRGDIYLRVGATLEIGTSPAAGIGIGPSGPSGMWHTPAAAEIAGSAAAGGPPNMLRMDSSFPIFGGNPHHEPMSTLGDGYATITTHHEQHHQQEHNHQQQNDGNGRQQQQHQQKIERTENDGVMMRSHHHCQPRNQHEMPTVIAAEFDTECGVCPMRPSNGDPNFKTTTTSGKNKRRDEEAKKTGRKKASASSMLLLRSKKTTVGANNSSSNEKCYMCTICGRQYCRKSTLKAHMKHHLFGDRPPFNCQICGRHFTQAANLTAHRRVHTGEKPFCCPICYRPFSQSSSLVTHKRTHTGERPYPCPHCEKAFTDSSTLTKHLRTHTGHKPYCCSLCMMKFSQSGNLHRHMKTHMNIDGNLRR